ncbi:unnamed protein product [Mytilus coruscus]|uniref:AIG1-type G domain-containing protein n=1 Tax=Mytilus coruscus TaxID=42192 RepID=A0A6J8F258_MYTCO|nr:unnamed protein product [Mytilus coruscus]
MKQSIEAAVEVFSNSNEANKELRKSLNESTMNMQQNKESKTHTFVVENENCIRLDLLGNTGSGNSATGTKIFDNDQFELRPSSLSVTNRCTVSKGKFWERQFVILDPSGLFNTNDTSYKATKEIVHCIIIAYPGLHAFLLVIKADRFTDEENKATNIHLELFGDHMLAFTVVIFTRLDDIEEEGISIDTFVKGSTEALNRLIKRVNFRYISFNNRGTTTQKLSYISSLKNAYK